MPPYGLTLLSQATTTGGPSLVPTNGPNGWVGQRGDVSTQGSLAIPWGSGTPKILRTPSPTFSHDKWSFVTEAPPSIELASPTWQREEPTAGFAFDGIQKRESSDDGPAPRTNAEKAVLPVAMSLIVLGSIAGGLYSCIGMWKSPPTRSDAVDGITRSTASADWICWPKSLSSSAIRKKRSGQGDMNSPGPDLELGSYTANTTNANQQASESPTGQDAEASQPTSTVLPQSGVSRTRTYWQGLASKLPSIRELPWSNSRTKTARSASREHQVAASNTIEADQQAFNSDTSTITRISEFDAATIASSHSSSSRPSMDGANPVECRDFIGAAR
jgi:hypothetical protein